MKRRGRDRNGNQGCFLSGMLMCQTQKGRNRIDTFLSEYLGIGLFSALIFHHNGEWAEKMLCRTVGFNHVLFSGLRSLPACWNAGLKGGHPDVLHSLVFLQRRKGRFVLEREMGCS